jgi:hypothetical protein
MAGILVAVGEARVDPVAVAGLLAAGFVFGSPTAALAGRPLVVDDVSVRDVFSLSVLEVSVREVFSLSVLDVSSLDMFNPFFSVTVFVVDEVVDLPTVFSLRVVVVVELLAGSLLEGVGLVCFPLT